MTLLTRLVIGSTGGGGGQQQSSGQQSGQQGGSQPSMMGLLSKASKSGHSAIVSGTMSLVSAYQSRRTNRKRAMKRGVLGIALLGLGFWQLRMKSRSGSKSGSGGQQSGSGQQKSVA